MIKKDFKIWKNKGFKVKGFNPLNELNNGRINKMPKQKVIDDFTDTDKVQAQTDFWKFKENKEVIGLFKRFETDSFGEHCVLQTEDEIELHLPNLTALNGKLKSGQVQEGNKVKICYVGQTKAKQSGRLYEDFDVFIKTSE